MPNDAEQPDSIDEFDGSGTIHFNYDFTGERDELKAFIDEIGYQTTAEEPTYYVQYEIMHPDGTTEWKSTRVWDIDDLDGWEIDADDGESTYDGVSTGAYGVTVIGWM